MIVSYVTKDTNGVKSRHVFNNVAFWRDETSEYDPYILRVIYGINGIKYAGPMVGEFTEWEEKENE